MSTIFFQFNVTSIVDLQAMGIYLKVCCDGKERNLPPILLLQCMAPIRMMIVKPNNNKGSLNT